jgi:hypothetical protein
MCTDLLLHTAADEDGHDRRPSSAQDGENHPDAALLRDERQVKHLLPLRPIGAIALHVQVQVRSAPAV